MPKAAQANTKVLASRMIPATAANAYGRRARDQALAGLVDEDNERDEWFA
jgi:hypothetical protein